LEFCNVITARRILLLNFLSERATVTDARRHCAEVFYSFSYHRDALVEQGIAVGVTPLNTQWTA
jgi:hypothetical protein